MELEEIIRDGPANTVLKTYRVNYGMAVALCRDCYNHQKISTEVDKWTDEEFEKFQKYFDNLFGVE